MPVTRIPYDEPFPRGLCDRHVHLLSGEGLTALCSLAAVVTVGLQLCESCDWPPLFGWLTAAYSISRFWTHSQHQMMHSTAELAVQYLLHDVLKIKHGTYLSNYGKVFGAFYWAYLMHV